MKLEENLPKTIFSTIAGYDIKDEIQKEEVMITEIDTQ